MVCKREEAEESAKLARQSFSHEFCGFCLLGKYLSTRKTGSSCLSELRNT